MRSENGAQFSREAEALRSRARGERGTMAGREGAAMTEEEWLTSEDPDQMIASIVRRHTARKLQFYGVARCRQNDDVYADPRFRRAIDLADAKLDGPINEETRARAEIEAFDAYEEIHFDELDDHLMCPGILITKDSVPGLLPHFGGFPNTWAIETRVIRDSKMN